MSDGRGVSEEAFLSAVPNRLFLNEWEICGYTNEVFHVLFIAFFSFDFLFIFAIGLYVN